MTRDRLAKTRGRVLFLVCYAALLFLLFFIIIFHYYIIFGRVFSGLKLLKKCICIYVYVCVCFFADRYQGRFLCFCIRIIARIENLKIKLK